MLLRKKNTLAGGRRTDVDMTEGNITRHIIVFAIPLLLGNIFQQLYNMVDTWVVQAWSSANSMVQDAIRKWRIQYIPPFCLPV